MKHSIHIEAPVDTTFDFVLGLFKDPTRWPEFFSGVVADDVKENEEGVGTYISWHTRFAGLPVQGFEVLTDVVPHQHITERSSNALVGTWDYDFEPEGSGTKLTLEQHAGSFWRVPPLHTLVDMARAGQLDSFMTRVKDELETASS